MAAAPGPHMHVMSSVKNVAEGLKHRLCPEVELREPGLRIENMVGSLVRALGGCTLWETDSRGSAQPGHDTPGDGGRRSKLRQYII